MYYIKSTKPFERQKNLVHVAAIILIKIPLEIKFSIQYLQVQN